MALWGWWEAGVFGGSLGIYFEGRGHFGVLLFECLIWEIKFLKIHFCWILFPWVAKTYFYFKIKK